MFTLKAFNDGCHLHQFCRPQDVVGDIVQDDDDEQPPPPPLQVNLSAFTLLLIFFSLSY